MTLKKLLAFIPVFIIRNSNFFPDLFELRIEISSFEGFPRGNIHGKNHFVEFRSLGKKSGKGKFTRFELSIEVNVMILYLSSETCESCGEVL
jgi:hypothetical protein